MTTLSTLSFATCAILGRPKLPRISAVLAVDGVRNPLRFLVKRIVLGSVAVITDFVVINR